MRSDWHNDQLPPPEDSEDRPNGFISIAILGFAIVAPFIYFGPNLEQLKHGFSTSVLGKGSVICRA